MFCVRAWSRRPARLVLAEKGGKHLRPRLVFLSFFLSHAGIRVESFVVGFFRSLLGERRRTVGSLEPNRLSPGKHSAVEVKAAPVRAVDVNLSPLAKGPTFAVFRPVKWL